MAKPLKIFLAIVGGLLLLIAGAAAAVVMMFDPNDYKADIEAAVEDNTGREFTLEGDLSLKVFPWLAVQAGPARLANAKGFGETPFAEVGTLSAGVRLLPIFSGKVELSTVTLDGLRLRLAVDEQGNNNWDDLSEAQADADAKPDDETPPDTEQTGGMSMEEFSIQAIAITDAAVSFDNRQTQQAIALQNFELSTGRVKLGSPTTVRSNFDISQKNAGQALTARVDLVTEVLADLEKQVFKSDNIQLEVTARGDELPGGEQQATLRGSARADLESGTFSLRELVLQAANGTVTGEVEGSGINGKPNADGRKEITVLGEIKTEGLNPRGVMAALGMEAPQTQDSGALTSFSLESRFKGNPRALEFPAITAKLDGSTLTGDFSLNDLDQAKPPKIAFALNIDKLNIDRYNTPTSDGAAADEQDAEQAEPGTLPLDWIDPLHIYGKLTVAAFTAAGASAQDAVLTLTSVPGGPLNQALTASLYGGKVEMTNRVAAGRDNAPPEFRLQGSLDQILAGALLKDAANQNWLDGSGFIRYDLTTRGTTADALKSALDGSIRLSLEDGAVRGVNIAQLLQFAQNQLSNPANAESVEANGGSTQFDALGATLNLNNGIVRNDDLSASNDQVGVAGTGQFSLLDMQLDYTLNTTLKQVPDGNAWERLRGVALPIRVTGPATSPKIRLDLASVVRSQIRAEGQAVVDEQRERLNTKIEEEAERARSRAGEAIQRGLGDLFGRRRAAGQDGAESDSGEQNAAEPDDTEE